jgi:predicted DNA binding protein
VTLRITFAQSGSGGTTGSRFPSKAETATVGKRQEANDTDEAFIRRMSKDLRGTEPTPTEVHFFVTSKEANRREKLVDLFIAERKEKDKAAILAERKEKEAAIVADRKKEDERRDRDQLLEQRKRQFEKDKAQQTPPDQALLRTNVELAKLTAREKKILVDAARNGPERDPTKISLLEIELARSVVLLEQAELKAKIAAEKASEK